MKFAFHWVENIVKYCEKRKKSWRPAFSFLPLCFQKLFFFQGHLKLHFAVKDTKLRVVIQGVFNIYAEKP